VVVGPVSLTEARQVSSVTLGDVLDPPLPGMAAAAAAA